jgi:hypothetical protein
MRYSQFWQDLRTSSSTRGGFALPSVRDFGDPAIPTVPLNHHTSLSTLAEIMTKADATRGLH